MSATIAILLTLLNLAVYVWPFARDLLALALLWRIGTWLKKTATLGVLLTKL